MGGRGGGGNRGGEEEGTGGGGEWRGRWNEETGGKRGYEQFGIQDSRESGEGIVEVSSERLLF